MPNLPTYSNISLNKLDVTQWIANAVIMVILQIFTCITAFLSEKISKTVSTQSYQALNFVCSKHCCLARKHLSHVNVAILKYQFHLEKIWYYALFVQKEQQFYNNYPDLKLNHYGKIYIIAHLAGYFFLFRHFKIYIFYVISIIRNIHVFFYFVIRSFLPL